MKRIVGIIVLVAILATGSFAAWQRWRQPKNNYTPTDQLPAQQTAGYLTIDTYHVRIPLNDQTKNLKLGEIVSSSYNADDKSVSILSPELDADWTCSPNPTNSSKGTIGNISITTQAKRSGPYEPLVAKRLNAVNYGFEGTDTTNCTKNPRYQELVRAFKAQFQQLETY